MSDFSVELPGLEFVHGKVLDNFIIIGVVTVTLYSRSWRGVSKTEATCFNKHFGVTRVTFITNSSVIQSDDPVEEPHLLVELGSLTKDAFQLKVKYLFKFSLVPFDIFKGTEA